MTKNMKHNTLKKYIEIIYNKRYNVKYAITIKKGIEKCNQIFQSKNNLTT